LFSSWPGGGFYLLLLKTEHVAVLALLLWAALRGPQDRHAARLGALIPLAMACLVGQKAMNYLALWEPWVALTAAQACVSMFSQKPAFRRLARGTVLLFSIGSIFYAGRLSFLRPRYTEISRAIDSLLPPGARVAGPQVFWPGLARTDYRDIGALTWHRLLKNEKDLFIPLEAFKPSYLLLDRETAERLSGSLRQTRRWTPQPPLGFLPWPHRILGRWDGGPSYGGVLLLVEILRETAP
jgi:hypothetical protein